MAAAVQMEFGSAYRTRGFLDSARTAASTSRPEGSRHWCTPIPSNARISAAPRSLRTASIRFAAKPDRNATKSSPSTYRAARSAAIGIVARSASIGFAATAGSMGRPGLRAVQGSPATTPPPPPPAPLAVAGTTANSATTTATHDVRTTFARVDMSNPCPESCLWGKRIVPTRGHTRLSAAKPTRFESAGGPMHEQAAPPSSEEEVLHVRLDRDLLRRLQEKAHSLQTDEATFVRWCIMTGVFLSDVNSFVRVRLGEEARGGGG